MSSLPTVEHRTFTHNGTNQRFPMLMKTRLGQQQDIDIRDPVRLSFGKRANHHPGTNGRMGFAMFHHGSQQRQLQRWNLAPAVILHHDSDPTATASPACRV
ncbi:hypothetical protein D3C73_1499980 [compost metagenome]